MSTPKKGRLQPTPEILKPHGITFDINVREGHGLETLPVHVRIVREGLLDFDSFVIREALQNTADIDQIPTSAYRERREITNWEQERLREFIGTAKDIWDGAHILQDDLATEPRWQDLFNRTVFKQTEHRRSDRYPIPNITHMNHLACVSTGVQLWNEADSFRGLNNAYEIPTIPKPDIYFGFRIHDPMLYRDYGFGKDKFMQNFTVETLFQLIEKGLCPAPTSGFVTNSKERSKSNGKHHNIPLDDRLCFPWAVVELKRFERGNDTRLVSTACSQAANAASTALYMLESLSQFAEIKRNNEHIPPVVAVTCVGANIKVWLAYSCHPGNNQRDHRVMCIWEGSLLNFWNAIQFCRIIDNVFSWAQYILRPKLSQYIDHWREKNSGMLNPPLSQRDPTISTILNKVETQLGFLNISDPSELPGLVRLIVTLKEVIASTTQTTKPQEEEGGEKTEQNGFLNASIQTNTLHSAMLNPQTPPTWRVYEPKSVPSALKESSPNTPVYNSHNLTSFAFAASLDSQSCTATGIDVTRRRLESASSANTASQSLLSTTQHQNTSPRQDITPYGGLFGPKPASNKFYESLGNNTSFPASVFALLPAGNNVLETPKEMQTPVSSVRKKSASDNLLTTENELQNASADIFGDYRTGSSHFSKPTGFNVSDAGNKKTSTFAGIGRVDPTTNKLFKFTEDSYLASDIKRLEISTTHDGRQHTPHQSTVSKGIFETGLREKQSATTPARPIASVGTSISPPPSRNPITRPGFSVSSAESINLTPQQASGLLEGGRAEEVLSWEQLRERSKEDDLQPENRRRPLRLFHVCRLPDDGRPYWKSSYHITVRLPPTDVQYIRRVEPVIFGNNSLNFQQFTPQTVRRTEDKDTDRGNTWNLNRDGDEKDWEDIESGVDTPEIVPGSNGRRKMTSAVGTNLVKLPVATKPHRIVTNKQKRKQSSTSNAAKGIKVHSAAFRRTRRVGMNSIR